MIQPDEHTDCLKVPEFTRYAAEQTNYQRLQNGSIQRIEGKTDQIFDTLGVVHQTQNDLYKTITEINVATLAAMNRVADLRQDDFREHEMQRANDVIAENLRFSGIEKTIARIEKKTIWVDHMRRVPKKTWIILVSLTAFLVALLTILNLIHVI